MLLATILINPPTLTRWQQALLLLPLILWGMAVNNRRVAWVQLAFAVIGAWYWIEAGFSFSDAVGRFID